MSVLDSGMLVQGPQVAAFEREFASRIGTRHAIATSSGTTALHLALLAHGIGEGDEVITSAFTFVASVNSILYVRAKPVFADVDAGTFNLDPERVEAAITPRTKAIIPVHLYGQPCDMDAISAIAARHKLAIIEDAAQAVGATYRGRNIGTFGTACFSLYATKNVMSGEGGMVTTDDDEVATRVRLLRQHGMQERYRYEMLGFNFRMTDINAAIGRVQLGRMDEFTRKRVANASYLSEAITSVITPVEAPERTHVWHQYTIRLDGERNRDEAIKRLNSAGVGTGIFYPRGVHEFDHIKAVTGPVDLPATELVAREVISIPVHPGLDQDDLDYVAAEVNKL
jgi:perosamine synthetase